MKKWFSNYTAVLLAIVTVILGIIFVPKIPDLFDDGKPKLIIGEAEGAVGSTIEIPVEIKNNPGTWGGQIIIDFDSTDLIFVSADIGTAYETCAVNLADEKGNMDSVVIIAEHKINYEDNKSVLVNSYENGNVVMLKFMIKANALKGEHKITINSETNFCDANANLVENFEFENGTITVE